MKRLSALIVVMLLCLINCMPLAAADVQQQDGLEVTLSTEHSSYGISDTIVTELLFRNVGSTEINDISYDFVSPEGYLVEGKTEPISVGNLLPGESVTQRVSLRRVHSLLPQTGDTSSFIGALIALIASISSIMLLIASNRKSCQRIMSLILCVVLLSSTFVGIPFSSFAEQNETRSMSVEKMLSIGGKNVPLRVHVTYDMHTAYSRAEWIATLIRDAGIAPTTVDTVSYADIAGTRYQHEIETAVSLGMLTPASADDLFYPDAPATRDFSAAMAVRILKFICNPADALKTPDASQITYPSEASVAVRQGMLSLENGLFVPSRPLSENEADNIRAVVKDVLRSTIITEDGGAGITFQSGVYEVTTNDYTDQDGILTLPAAVLPDGIKAGNIIVLNGNKAYRIISISYVSDRVSLKYNEPELNEFIQEIDAHGFLRGNVGDFVPADGVNVVSQQSRVGNASSGLLGTLKLEGNKKVGKGKLFYEVSIAIPDGSFNFDANLLTMNFKNVYVSISPEITAQFTWGNEIENNEPSPKEKIFLGSVPLFGIHGTGVLVEFYIAFKADGKIGIETTVTSLMGFQVYNNQPRAFGDLDIDIIPMASGGFKIGPNFYLVAKLIGKNLISFGGFLAGYLEGSAKWRVEEGTCCIDGSVGGLLEIDMEDCLIAKLPVLKNQELNWEVFKHCIWNLLHIEITSNGVKPVPECTLNQGTLRGIVAHALDRSNYVRGAKIVLVGADGKTKTETSGSTGGYTIVTKEGDYTLKVSKDGYIPFDTDVTIVAGDTNVVETLLMVEGTENDSRTGTIGGNITNAKTGQKISNVKIDIREGWNKKVGPVVQTVYSNGNGQYEATLNLGNYTLTLIKDGFVTTSINVAVAHNTDRSHHGSMLPKNNSSEQQPMDRLSVVLTWDENPRDLDSHMRGYSANGNELFHTYYSNKSYYVNSGKQTFLDLDDTTSYGPETTTVMGMTNGEKYSFFVHDFTNRSNSSSNAMANSGAKVSVYRGLELLKEFHVPSQTGTVWHVFDYNVSTDTLTTVNSFSSTGNAQQVGSKASAQSKGQSFSDISPDKE